MTDLSELSALVEIYTGLSLGYVSDLNILNGGTRGEIHPNTVTALRWRGLVEPGEIALTKRGKAILERAQAILKSAYAVPPSLLTGSEAERLRGLDLRGLYRLEVCKAAGIKAEHLKALRSLALRPWQARAHVQSVYGTRNLEHLLEFGLVRGGGRPEDQIYPSKEGYDLVLKILELKAE